MEHPNKKGMVPMMNEITAQARIERIQHDIEQLKIIARDKAQHDDTIKMLEQMLRCMEGIKIAFEGSGVIA
jgi:hypothetical protein